MTQIMTGILSNIYVQQWGTSISKFRDSWYCGTTFR